jgi:H+/gluconate symporter-like permease
MWLLILLVLALVLVIVAMAKFDLHPFLALLVAAPGYGVLCRTMSLEDVEGGAAGIALYVISLIVL